jgi:hypothetical protein
MHCRSGVRALAKLQWAVALGAPLSAAMCAKAMGGHTGRLRNLAIEKVAWLRSVGCPWDADTCSAAVDVSNLEALK